MDQDKLVALVVEEVVRAYNQGPSSAPAAMAPDTPASPANGGNAVTRAAVLDFSNGVASRWNPLREEAEGEASPLNRPAAVIGISNRHIHLKPEHCDILYGPGKGLTPRNELRQPGQYAARETLTIITNRGRSIEGVRVLGPLRTYTQVELSRTDCFYLGIKPPVRPSGNHEGTPGIILVGPAGHVILETGVLIADRHIHGPPDWAKRWGLEDQQIVSCRAGGSGPKPTILDGVRIRLAPDYVLEAHLDTDDANACYLSNGDLLEVLL